MTVIELLVAMAILGVLTAVLLPAIGSARSSARRLQCQNNLKQVGLAVLNYQSTHRFGGPKHPDLVVQLNPFLEIDQEQSNPSGIFNSRYWNDPNLNYDNEVWLCPGQAVPPRLGGFHYVVNRYLNSHSRLEGYTKYGLWLKSPRDVVDGTSSTVMFGEKLLSVDNLLNYPMDVWGFEVDNPLLATWYISRDYGRGDWREIAAACESSRTQIVPTEDGLARRDLNLPLYIGLTFDRPPNSPSCYAGAHFDNGSVPTDHRQFGLYPVSSLHSGGANVVYGDGHVRFVSESIDAVAWRAQGSSQGNDL